MKKLFLVLMIIVVMFTLTGCGNKKVEEVVDDQVVVAKPKNAEKVIIDNQYITIKYQKKEYKKIPGLLNNKGTTFTLPTVLFTITNKLDEKIHFEVRATKDLINTIDYYFSLTNDKGIIDTSGTVIEAKKDLDVNVIYQKTQDLEETYPLDVFDEKTIYLRLYNYDTSTGSTKFIEEYEIDCSEFID